MGISTRWAVYTVVFTPPGDDPSALFNVNVGATRGSIWLDSFSISR